jgi:hypothetical protein
MVFFRVIPDVVPDLSGAEIRDPVNAPISVIDGILACAGMTRYIASLLD